MKIPSNYNLFFYIFFMEYFGNVLLVYRDLPTMHYALHCRMYVHSDDSNIFINI